MSTWLWGLSLAITLLSLPGAWVQARHVFRDRTTEGLALSTQICWVWSSAVWAGYGFVENNWLLLVTNVSSAIACALVVVAAKRFDGARLQRPMLWSAVAAVALLLAWRYIGPVTLVVVTGLMTVGSRLPQLYVSWKRPGGGAVNFFNFASAGVCSALWVVYAVILGDWFLAAMSAYCVAFSVFVVVQEKRAQVVIADLRFAAQLEAAALYEQHRHQERRLVRTGDSAPVASE